MNKKKVLSKFLILCGAAFTAILGVMWPVGHRLDTPVSTQPQIPIINLFSLCLVRHLMVHLECGLPPYFGPDT